MSLEHIYTELITKLSRDERAHLELSDQLLNEISSSWRTSLDTDDYTQLSKVLCILEHSKNFYAHLEPQLLETLEKNLPAQTIIFALATSWKQLLDRWNRSGDRVPTRYIEIMRNLLKHEDIEVREWTLRTIDQFGPQGRLLLKDISAARIGWRGILNPHAKAVAQLVEMLEKRWGTS